MVQDEGVSIGHECIFEFRTYKRDQLQRILGIDNDTVSMLHNLYGLLPLGSSGSSKKGGGYQYHGRNILAALENQATDTRVACRIRRLKKSDAMRLLRELPEENDG